MLPLAAAGCVTGHMLWEVLSGLYPFQQAGQPLLTVTEANNVSPTAAPWHELHDESMKVSCWLIWGLG